MSQPRLAAVGENMSVGATGLVGVTDISSAICVHEIKIFGLLESIVQFVTELVFSSHQPDKFRNVMGDLPSGLPGIRLDPSLAFQRIFMHPIAIFVFREYQALFRIEQGGPAMGASLEFLSVISMAEFGSHAAKSPVLEGPFESLAGTLGTPTVLDVELQVGRTLIAHHATWHVVPFYGLKGGFRIHFTHDVFQEGAGYHITGRASSHDE